MLTDREVLVARARALRTEGMTLVQIGALINRPQSTIHNWVADIPPRCKARGCKARTTKRTTAARKRRARNARGTMIRQDPTRRDVREIEDRCAEIEHVHVPSLERLDPEDPDIEHKIAIIGRRQADLNERALQMSQELRDLRKGSWEVLTVHLAYGLFELLPVWRALIRGEDVAVTFEGATIDPADAETVLVLPEGSAEAIAVIVDAGEEWASDDWVSDTEMSTRDKISKFAQFLRERLTGSLERSVYGG